MLNQKRSKNGRFLSIQLFYKACKLCFDKFETTSGNSNYCELCRKELMICMFCNGLKKDIYHKFCSNSCAGKYKFIKNKKVRDALKLGQNHPVAIHKARERFKNLKGKPRLDIRGEKNPNWKGGSLNLRRTDMGRVEYINWRVAVFERDSFTCQICYKKGIYVEADHIIPYSVSIEKRYDISNGRTLCRPCHMQTDTWGNKAKNFKKERII